MFKILALDGGGIKGVFTAAYLSQLETATSKRMADYFDLIVGTSTGGIIALALGLGMPAAEICELYLSHGAEIFPRRSMIHRLVRGLFRSQYDSSPLRKALEKTFEQRRLGESQTRLCIPSFNATVSDVWVYKTAHHEKLRNDYKLRVADVALATSAAPTFLPASETASGALHVDGGMWANNPAMLGYAEAVGLLGVPADEVFLLSVGSTEESLDWNKVLAPALFGTDRRLPVAVGT